MAFDKDRSIIAQNSGGHAAAVVVALINAGVITTAEEARDTLRNFQTDVFNGVIALAGAETVVTVFEGGNTESDAPRPQPVSSTGKPFGDTVFKTGKYSGKSIEDVYNSGDEGREYIEKYTTFARNEYMRNAVTKFLAA